MKRKPNCVGQRIVLVDRNQIGKIYGTDVHFDTKSGGEEFSVALVLIFVEISPAHGKFMIIPVFCSQRIVDLLQLFTGTSGGIREGGEDGADHGFACIDARAVKLRSRHHQFVEIQGEGERVERIQFGGVSGSQFEIGRKILLVAPIVVGYSGSDVRQVDTGSNYVLVGARTDVLVVEEGDIRGKGISGYVGSRADSAGEVRSNVPQSHTSGEVVGKLSGITEVQCKFTWFDSGQVTSILVCELNFPHRKIAQGSSDGLGRTQLVISGQIGQVHIADQLPEPGSEGERYSKLLLCKGQFGWIPVLRIGIGRSSRPNITHGTVAGVGRDG